KEAPHNRGWPAPMTQHKRTIASYAAVAALLLVLAGLRLQNPELHRPFEMDELLTVQYYTWVGVYPSGEYRPLNHVEDFYALGPPTASQLAMGLYCSMGRWPEPNNHILHSLFVNGVLTLGGRDEWWVRLPAVLGGVVFAGGLYYLCSSILRWTV